LFVVGDQVDADLNPVFLPSRWYFSTSTMSRTRISPGLRLRGLRVHVERRASAGIKRHPVIYNSQDDLVTLDGEFDFDAVRSSST